MNLKKLYYLSERIYEPIKCGEESVRGKKGILEKSVGRNNVRSDV